MPAGGFGNLIALPLQRRARERGDSLFVDDELRPPRRPVGLPGLARPPGPGRADRPGGRGRDPRPRRARRADAGRGRGRRRAVAPAALAAPGPEPVAGPLPERVGVVLADGLYVDRSGLPPPLVARLVRLAAFQNPEFYRAQAMRLSTFGKPRVASCAELHPRHVALPRGCLDEALELFHSHGIRTD